MKFTANTTAIATLIVLGAAAYEYSSKREFFIGPGTLLLIALLLGVRYVGQLQRRKKAQMLAAVPKKPLGLD